ncbi:MAG: Imelysin [Roseomonas sp.]|nr:Imelysin [Roseomonas sp.]
MQRRSLLFAAPALLVAHAALAVPDEAGFRALNKAVVEGVVLPGYRLFAGTTAAFAGTLAALAKAPAEPAPLEAARRGWADTMLAWQGIQHLRFGPADLFSRHQRIQFWPDPRGAIDGDLADAIGRRDAALLEVRPNAISNVTALGLPAAERLLFDGDAAQKLATADAEAAYRAALLGAIGATLAAIGRDMLEGWTSGENPYAAVMIDPRMPYASPKEATLELFKAMHAAVRAVSDRKLGLAADTGQVQLLEAWRARLSGPCVAADIVAARQMFRAGFGPALEKDGQGEVAALLTGAFEQAAAAAAALPLPIEEALADPTRRAQVQALRREATALKALMAQHLPRALDLPQVSDVLATD